MQNTAKKPVCLAVLRMVFTLLAGGLFPSLIPGPPALFSGGLRAAEMPDFLPPDRLDIQDPFMRGLKRAAEASAGLKVDGLPTDGLPADGQPAPPALGDRQLEQLAAAADFRLAGVLSRITPKPDPNRQAQPSPASRQPGAPRRAFIELGQAKTAAPLHQLAADLEHRLGVMLGHPLSIRERAGTNHLEIGPLSSLLHAERTCLLLRRAAGGLLPECRVTLFLHSGDAPPAARALLRLSAAAADRLSSTYPELDTARLASQLVWAREGQMLGHDGYVIVRITPTSVIAVNADGQIVRLGTNAPAEQPRLPQHQQG